MRSRLMMAEVARSPWTATNRDDPSAIASNCCGGPVRVQLDGVETGVIECGSRQQVPPGVSDGDVHVERLDLVEVAEAAGDDRLYTGRASRDPASLREVLRLWVHSDDPPAESGERREEPPGTASDVEHAQ